MTQGLYNFLMNHFLGQLHTVRPTESQARGRPPGRRPGLDDRTPRDDGRRNVPIPFGLRPGLQKSHAQRRHEKADGEGEPREYGRRLPRTPRG